MLYCNLYKYLGIILSEPIYEIAGDFKFWNILPNCSSLVAILEDNLISNSSPLSVWLRVPKLTFFVSNCITGQTTYPSQTKPSSSRRQRLQEPSWKHLIAQMKVGDHSFVKVLHAWPFTSFYILCLRHNLRKRNGLQVGINVS